MTIEEAKRASHLAHIIIRGVLAMKGAHEEYEKDHNVIHIKYLEAVKNNSQKVLLAQEELRQMAEAEDREVKDG